MGIDTDTAVGQCGVGVGQLDGRAAHVAAADAVLDVEGLCDIIVEAHILQILDEVAASL